MPPPTAPAKRGDKVTLDFEGFREGQPIPDSKMENVTVLLGTGKLMPAAEKAVYGHKAGETFQFDFTYPANFRVENLSGVTAQFTIRLHAVAEKHTPAADEAFARSRGFDSLEAMRAQIRKEKQAPPRGGSRPESRSGPAGDGRRQSDRRPAEKQLAAEAQREYKALEEKLKQSGVSLDAYCKSCRTTPDQLRASYRKIAEKRLRSILAAKAIAEAEGITASSEEVNAEYRRLSAQRSTPRGGDPQDPLSRRPVGGPWRPQKVQAFLLKNARVTTVHDQAPEHPAKKED